MEESLAFLMHRNGLRELWFDNGLSYKELTVFLKAFRSYEILKGSRNRRFSLGPHRNSREYEKCHRKNGNACGRTQKRRT
jgi:hypothetical protein